MYIIVINNQYSLERYFLGGFIMINHMIKYIITLTIILLLTLTASAYAYASAVQTTKIFEMSASGNEPSDYQLPLLLQLIDNYNPSLSLEQKKMVCKTILKEAQISEFDPFFISSIIAAESSFCPHAISPCKALGLMQLTSCVSQAMHIHDPFNIQENIYAGTRFLKYLKTQFSDNNLILAAYNAGPTRVARLGRIPHIKETISYINKVNSTYQILRQALFSSIQRSLNKPLLCQTINAITNGNRPIPIALHNHSANQNLVLVAADIPICEVQRSTRLIVDA
jgi:hypothetical protein